jgi:hypothetical protein
MRIVGALLLTTLCACGPLDEDAPEQPWVDGEIGVFRHDLTVGQAGGCSTAIVAGLTAQLIGEQNCLKPNALVKFSGSGISVGSSVNAYLEPPAVNALKSAVQKRGGTIIINSALRSLAQQYLLYKWQGTCGIQIAAAPGRSNHETGIALDVDNYDLWRTALEAEGWDWYGTGDRVHYDYRGPGAADLRATSVLAFQKLWNLNNPNDKIDEDGVYGPMTDARLSKSPAGGFAKPSTCTTMPPPPPPPTKPEWDAELVSVEAPEMVLAGQIAQVRVTFRNTGTRTWKPGSTRLGTIGPRDRDSALAGPGWIAPNRPAHVEADTAPGALGHFIFTLLAPEVEAARAFDEDFGLVEEAVAWFPAEANVAFSVEVRPNGKADAQGTRLQPGAFPEEGASPGGCAVSGRAPAPPVAVLALLWCLLRVMKRRASSR